MRFAGRKFCHVLLIFVMIGIGVLTLHAGTHLLGDQPSCALCSGHANPSHAMAPSLQHIELPAPLQLEFELPALPESSPHVRHYESRAPPTFA